MSDFSDLLTRLPEMISISKCGFIFFAGGPDEDRWSMEREARSAFISHKT